MALPLPSDDEGPFAGPRGQGSRPKHLGEAQRPVRPVVELLPVEVMSDEDLGPPLHGSQMNKCCPKNCTEQVLGAIGREVKELREDLRKLGAEERDDFLWDLLRASKSASDNYRSQWLIRGIPVCRRSWKQLVGIGSKKLGKMCEALSSGRLRPPEDQRKLNRGTKLAEKYLDADSFFNFLYHYVAEPLADADETAPEVVAATLAGEEGAPAQAPAATRAELCVGAAPPVDWEAKLAQWLSGRDTGSAAATSGMVAVVEGIGERRWLAHMSKQELYELYLFHGAPGTRPRRRGARCSSPASGSRAGSAC